MKRHLAIAAMLLCVLSVAPFTADTFQLPTGAVTGSVKDPKNAVIVGAQITIRNETNGESRNATTDGEGKFKIETLAPGSYRVNVTRPGFKTAERAVSIESGKTTALEIKLEIAETKAELTVGAKGTIAGNTDPNYRALRDSQPAETYSVANLTIKRDVGVMTLKSGTVSFLPPVLGRAVIGVFNGEGEFTLTPAFWIEQDYLKFLTGKDAFADVFNRAVFTFSDDTYQEIKKQGQTASADSRAADALKDFQRRMRRNTETPRSMTEAMLTGEDVENIEAELLNGLYNSKRAPFFNAYIFGKKYNDLRFLVRPDGAMPGLPAPEEVALIHLDPLGKEDGILYLAHLESEIKSGRAGSGEDKRLFDVEHYKIETAIRGEKLAASCELTFKALANGDRVIGFGLLPTLRVTRVTMGGADIHFVQEKKNDDSAFYAILPEATVKDRQYKMTIEYGGEKVLTNAGGGSFYVSARTSWYPSVNAFTDRATFDLTFKVPNKYTLVSNGKLVKEAKEEDLAVTQWVSEIPLAVAGFNYGSFKKKSITDEQTGYQIEGYATTEVPDYLKGSGVNGMAPSRLMDNTLIEAQNSIRIFNQWFSPAPYGRIAITQQPDFNFGQSWPSLVYLPLSAYLDSTQRWQLIGLSSGFTDFIQEVTSHEVAHQWWGHIVGWASFHDQWLSEGFSDFSASLYLQATEQKPDKYLRFWDQSRKTIIEKDLFGRRPTDVGPLWTGLRLSTAKSPGAYQKLVYPKGGYVLHMLRWMMYDRQTGDQKFKAMMQDFVKQHFNQNASTESFKAIVEKHMLPTMDLDGNKTMNWFFLQWVYGTEIPRYRIDYTLTPESDGKTLLTCKVTQSDVSPGFKMIVPIYLDFDGGKVMRLGAATLVGNTTTNEFKVKLDQKPKRVLINYNHDVLATESVSVGK
ncbi:MAG: carboxypeptidase regulatory-like domain-containing protein [Blastocatellia bacterium]